MSRKRLLHHTPTLDRAKANMEMSFAPAQSVIYFDDGRTEEWVDDLSTDEIMEFKCCLNHYQCLCVGQQELDFAGRTKKVSASAPKCGKQSYFYICSTAVKPITDTCASLVAMVTSKKDSQLCLDTRKRWDRWELDSSETS